VGKKEQQRKILSTLLQYELHVFILCTNYWFYHIIVTTLMLKTDFGILYL